MSPVSLPHPHQINIYGAVFLRGERHAALCNHGELLQENLLPSILCKKEDRRIYVAQRNPSSRRLNLITSNIRTAIKAN